MNWFNKLAMPKKEENTLWKKVQPTEEFKERIRSHANGTCSGTTYLMYENDLIHEVMLWSSYVDVAWEGKNKMYPCSLQFKYTNVEFLDDGINFYDSETGESHTLPYPILYSCYAR